MHEYGHNPAHIPKLYVRLNRIERAFFGISFAALVTTYFLAQFSSQYDTLAFAGIGLFFLWIASKITLDVWFWWIVRHLDLWLYQNVKYIEAHQLVLKESESLFDLLDQLGWSPVTPEDHESVVKQSAKHKTARAALRELRRKLIAAHKETI